eukprot:COSAG02_NODE_906_length_16039_cov_4.410289_1_plen_866_part_00
MNVCKVRVGPSAAETLARYHLGQRAVDPGEICLDYTQVENVAWGGQTLGIIAEFGPRSASLPNCAAVVVQPEMADSSLTNAHEVRGCVAIVRRGNDVPLVVKARRCMEAGARAVLIINTDDQPLVADAHRFPGHDSMDAGDDITVPVLVVPSSASGLLQSAGAGVSLDYDTATTKELSVEEYARALQAATRATVPEGIPSPNEHHDTVTSKNQALQGANEHGMQEQVHVHEQWSTEQLKEERRRVEAELSELRARLGSDDTSNISGTSIRSAHVGSQRAEGMGATAAAATTSVTPPMVMQTTMYQPMGASLVHGHTTGACSAPVNHLQGTDVEALRGMVSAEAEATLRDKRDRLAAAEKQLFDTKTELASLKGELTALTKERDDERQRVHTLQVQLEMANVQLETASVSRQVASADLEATREQQKARATEAIETAARLQRSQASLSAEIARRRSTEAALDEATALNRELQAEKTVMNQALLSAQASAVQMEETRAQSDARLDKRLAAAQQAAAVQEERRREAEATLQSVRTDLGEQMAAVMDASKAAMEDVRRMQKEDEKRLAAALDKIATLEAAAVQHVEMQRQLEQGRDAIAAAAASASEDASAEIEAIEQQRSRDAEQAGMQLAAAQAETQKYKQEIAETTTKLQDAEHTIAAHEQREASLTAELQVTRAENNAAMESAKHEAQKQQEASKAALARLKQAHELELQALRKSANEVLARKVASLEAEAAEHLGAALQESQARHELAMRDQQGEHELTLRTVRMEVETETKAAAEAQASATEHQVASEHRRQLDKLRAEAVALREEAKAQVAELHRVKAEDMQRLMKAGTEEVELVRSITHVMRHCLGAGMRADSRPRTIVVSH